MIYWIKRFAHIVSYVAGFAVFFVTLDPSDPMGLESMGWALAKGCAAMALFWFVGYIIGDIIFKGVVEDVPKDIEEDPVEGGLLQRVLETKASGPFSGTEQGQKPAGRTPKVKAAEK